MPSLGSSEPIVVAIIAVIGLLVVACLVGWGIEAFVSSMLFRLSRRCALPQRQSEREVQVLGDAIRVKRLLDSQAFQAHQEMVRIAREHSTHER